MPSRDSLTVETPEFMLAALEQAPDAVIIVDSDGRVRHFNAAAERIWRLPRAEVLGGDTGHLGLLDLQPQQVAPPAPAQLSPDNPAKSGTEITIRQSDGTPVRVALSVSRIEASGRTNTMMFARDITAEVEQRERNALLTLVADKSNRAVVVTDRKLEIVYTNDTFARMFGYSPEEAKGRHVGQLLFGRYTDRAAMARLRRRIGAGCGGDEEILAYDRNGDEIWLAVTAKVFRDERGRIKNISGLLTDISETRQLRSLQQLIMDALAGEVPITEIADRLCRRVETIAPDVVSSVLHVDADGMVHPLEIGRAHV